MSKEMKSILFTGSLFIMFCIMALEANTFADKAKFFPLFVALGAVFIALVSITLQTIQLIKSRKSNENKDEEEAGETGEMIKYVLWIIGYVALIYIIGFMPATILFLLAFLLVESKFRIITTIPLIVLVVGVLVVFSNIMNLYWPTGLLNITIL